MEVGVLTLNTYSLRDLQTASALLTQALSEGQSLQSLLDLIGTRVRAIAPIGQEKYPSVSGVERHCPGCRVRLYLCHESSRMAGADVYVCSRHCGYSEVRGGR